MGLPKDKVVDRRRYLANLLTELRFLNDKINGLRFYLSDEFTQTRERFGNLLDGIVYLYYESAIVQLTWLLGKDKSNSETSLIKHKAYVMESKQLEKFAEIWVRKKGNLDIDVEDQKTKLIDTIEKRVAEYDMRIAKHSESIKNARHTLFAHKSIFNFNKLHLNTLDANFAPTFDDVCDTGEALIELALYLFYIQSQGETLNLHDDENRIEANVFIEICKALNK
jgi:hypothetical protein